MKNKLYTLQNTFELDINEIKKLYRLFTSSNQVNMISSFDFGNDSVEKAEGNWIYTTCGKKILDFTGGIGVLNIGHNHPRILAARIRYQKEKKMEVYKNYLSPYIAALSHNIAQLLPEDLNISYFCNSGAEAVEGSMKLAYKYHNHNRKYILHSDISFHGKLFGSGSITGSPEVHYKFPSILNVDNFKYNNFSSVLELVSKYRKNNSESDIYAIIIEPFSASSLRSCSKQFLFSLRELCTKENIVLIFDEVFSGWYKTGKLFNFFRFDGLYPDVLTYSKSFGGGKSSISGYTARENFYRKAYDNKQDVTLHSTTYNGLGEETITAIEAINIMIEDDYEKKASRIESELKKGLQSIKNKYPNIIEEVNGSGALYGVVFKSAPKSFKKILKSLPISLFKDNRFIDKLITAAIIADLYKNHNILTNFASNEKISLWVSPCLVASSNEIKYFLKGFDSTLSKGLLSLVINFTQSKFFGTKN